MAENEETPLSFDCPDLLCKAVTVYSDRAEVKRLVKTNIKAGLQEVTIRNLPTGIDKESIRVEGRGKAVLCGVQYQEKHITKGEKDQEHLDSIQQLAKEREEVSQHMQRLHRQRDVMDGVAEQIATGGQGKGKQQRGFVLSENSIESLEEFLNFYGDEVSDLDKEIQKDSDKIEDIQEKIRVLEGNRDPGELSDPMSREVSTLLDVSEDGKVELDLSYIVSGASWTPSYDVRVFSEEKTIKVHYYGLIKQNSGEDWNNTKISLSTATPSVGSEIPELKTLKVALPSFFSSYSSSTQKYRAKKKAEKSVYFTCAEMNGDSDSDEDQWDNDAIDGPMEVMPVKDTVVRDSGITTSFEIARKASIPSDNVEHKVNVVIVDLAPDFEYVTVPSKSPHAYAKARIVNKSAFAFLPGVMSVIWDNTFVAKSTMKAVSPMEEFTCSLGMDPSIKVEYKPVHKYREKTKGICCQTSVTVYDQKIEIKNTKAEEGVKVKILEHVPLSEDEKIKIVLMEPYIPKHEKEAADKPYKLNQANNLEWDVVIPGGQEKTVQLKYSIEHPKNEQIHFKEE